MADLKTYLAAKYELCFRETISLMIVPLRYMTGPKADAILARSTDPAVKKRRKKLKNEDYIGGSAHRGEANGLMFKDEDEEWRRRRDEAELEGEDAPSKDISCVVYLLLKGVILVLGKELATFRKSNSQWSTVTTTSLPLPSASIAGPSTLLPDIKPDPDEPPAPPIQLTKRKGGLRTAAQLQEEAERVAAEKSPSPPPDDTGLDPTATVHRDASGRIVDIEKIKEEERRKEEEEERKKKEREEWTKGLVQRGQRENRAREERDMARADVGR